MRMVIYRSSIGASFAFFWLTRRKRPGKICRDGQFCRFDEPEPPPSLGGNRLGIMALAAENRLARCSHSQCWITGHGSGAAVQSWPQRGAEDAWRPIGESISGGMRGAVGAGTVRATRGRDLAYQGPGQYRGCAAESADRLWPGGRS